MGFDGKVAVVTGAASGIGRAAATQLAARGARVVLLDRDADGVNAAAEAIEGETVAGVVDVADPAQVEASFANAIERFGRVDLLFNNAGIVIGGGALHELPLESFDKVLQVNLYGAFHVLAAGIRSMLAHGEGGAIVNTASIGGMRGFAGGGSYVASKHAVIGLTRTAALECAPLGIRVNALAPGRTATSIVSSAPGSEDIVARRSTAAQPALGRYGEPEEVAAVAVWLLSNEASFVTGGVYTADGGQTAA